MPTSGVMAMSRLRRMIASSTFPRLISLSTLVVAIGIVACSGRPARWSLRPIVIDRVVVVAPLTRSTARSRRMLLSSRAGAGAGAFGASRRAARKYVSASSCVPSLHVAGRARRSWRSSDLQPCGPADDLRNIRSIPECQRNILAGPVHILQRIACVCAVAVCSGNPRLRISRTSLKASIPPLPVAVGPVGGERYRPVGMEQGIGDLAAERRRKRKLHVALRTRVPQDLQRTVYVRLPIAHLFPVYPYRPTTEQSATMIRIQRENPLFPFANSPIHEKIFSGMVDGMVRF